MDLSTFGIFASFLVGSVGFVFFVYGKKQVRMPQLVAGLTLMIFPYFVAGAGWTLGIGGGLVAGTWLLIRAGY